MLEFNKLFDTAAHRKGGADALELLLPDPRTPAELSDMGDDRFLAAMTRCVFRAGFVWRVVTNKWPGFERAFDGFSPDAVRHLSDENLEQLATDPDIIRNLTKIRAVRDNATYVADISRDHGGFGRYLASWPTPDITTLWRELKARGQRLGGNTGPFFLREVGCDTFLLTDDVVASLVSQQIVSKRPTSQRDLASVQQAFNEWQQQSNRPLSHISRILSFTVGDNLAHSSIM